MLRQKRSKTRSPNKPQLGSSWVVDDGDEDSDETYAPVLSPRSASHQSRRQLGTRNNRPIDTGPELIMPSIDGEPGESWVGEKEQRKRISKRSSRQMDTSHRFEPREAPKSAEPSQQRRSRMMDSVLNDVIKPIFQGLYDVLKKAFTILKTPISYVLALCLLLGLGVISKNLLTNSMTNALTPVCRLPFASYVVPICSNTRRSGGKTASVPFDDLMTVQSQFEEVLEVSAGGASLPLDMKRGEASIRDLRTLVRHSQLPSRNELGLEFDGFIETARIASFDLQKFNSHVGRGVDSVLATARWTRKVLDGITVRDAERGALVSLFNDRLLAPFQPFKFTENSVLEQYILHTRTVEDEIARLVTEAQALLQVLQNLEDRLDIIHGIAIRDRDTAQLSRDDVLSQLWTKLGGNAKALGKLESKIHLLGQVNLYRQSAFAHVSGTIVKLQEMAAGLEDLRERVGGVELVGGKRGVPLSVHIEQIELGVQRLEDARMRTRGIEGNAVRKVLDREKGDNSRMIEQ